MVLRKFGSGFACNEESENFEKGSHTIKAMLPEDKYRQWYERVV